MNSFLEQLNLTPQERRIVVAIVVVVFVVLNLLLVFPHFKDLKAVQTELDDTRTNILKWNKAIALDCDPGSNGYKVILTQLERQQGGGIVNQQIQLQRTVSDQAFKTGVSVSEIRPVNSASANTNSFYDEQSVKISFACQEAQLVNFLYNMGNDPAMIRVQELSLRPADANRYRLIGDAILTANYAKQPATNAPKTAPAATAKASPTAPPPRRPDVRPPPIPMPRNPMNPRPAPGAQSLPR